MKPRATRTKSVTDGRRAWKGASATVPQAIARALGAPRGKAAAQARQAARVCPHCGQPVSGQWRASWCWRCYKPLPWMEAAL
mgnify:CR=1 FL=1